MKPNDGAPVRCWTAEPLTPEVKTAIARISRSDDVQTVAVMPDVHLARDVCIGTVVATSRLVYPNAVGSDIGCGMAAVRLEGQASLLSERRTAARVLAGLSELAPILKHREPPEPPRELFARPLSDPSLDRHKYREGLLQIGTLGRGNHFLEIQRDQDQVLWLMVHTGSRGIGQRIRDLHLTRCQKSRSGLGYLDTTLPDGQAYVADMQWAMDYAHESRRRLLRAASEVVEGVTGAGPEWPSLLCCSHNHVERVDLGHTPLWVHRKGAISARDGEPGIIPGSMASPSFHVAGRGTPEALWSSSHGAGRLMSRTDARRRISAQDLADQTQGVWLAPRTAHRLVDEAPAAYKDITRVMAAQRGLTKTVRRLEPLLSFKGA